MQLRVEYYLIQTLDNISAVVLTIVSELLLSNRVYIKTIQKHV